MKELNMQNSLLTPKLRSALGFESLAFVYVFLLAGSLGAQSVYTPYTFTTLAGSAGVQGTNDGTGSAARFYVPQGVATDSSGNVYVADADNYTIRKITPAGVVTTLAGLAGSYGSADGTGSAARFYHPSAVATDPSGNVYVADTSNDTIRKVTPGGVVTTLAGSAGVQGTNDGTGSAAQFRVPFGVATDSAGNVYVADTDNYTIRKITPGGVVTTLAGLAGSYGTNDGTGSAARFFNPEGVATDSSGNVYVADTWNHTIRKITPAGVVTTLAGLAGSFGSADGTGSAALFHYPHGVATDSSGNVYVADDGNYTIRKGFLPQPQLTILLSGVPPSGIVLTWPTNAVGFTLQCTTNLASPVVWSTNSPAPVVIGDQNVVTNPITGPQQFFRLVQ